MSYISEAGILELVEKDSAAAKAQGISHIYNPSGFSGHLIDTGKFAEKIAGRILAKHPDLRILLGADIVRTAGYMHDFGKIRIGDPYHEIEGAYIILTRGGEEGLAPSEGALREIAHILPGDSVLLRRELGDDFPNTALHPEFVTNRLVEQYNFLVRALTSQGKPLDLDKFALPNTIERKVCMYSDLSNVNCQEVSVEERCVEILERYRGFAKEDPDELKRRYFGRLADLIEETMEQRLTICEEVRDLAK